MATHHGTKRPKSKDPQVANVQAPSGVDQGLQTGAITPIQAAEFESQTVRPPPTGVMPSPPAPVRPNIPASEVEEGRILLSSGGYFLQVYAAGDTLPVLSGGYGGWETVDRPRRSPLVNWVKSDAFRLSLPILIDRFSENATVESAISLLEDWALPKDGLFPDPPIIFVTGGPVPARARVKQWVIENIEWGDDAIVNEAAHRIRQSATLTLLERADYDGDVLQIDPLKPTTKKKVDCDKAKAPKDRKRVVVRKGDTLPKLSARYLGSDKCWKKIATLNKIRDPKTFPGKGSKSWIGKKIRLP